MEPIRLPNGRIWQPSSRSSGLGMGVGAIDWSPEDFQPETHGLRSSDFFKTFMSGAAGLVDVTGYLAKKIGVDPGGYIQNIGSSAADYWETALSDEAKAELSKSFVTRGEDGSLEWGDAGLVSALLKTVQSAPGMMATAGVGSGLAAGGRTAMSLGTKQGAARAADAAVKSAAASGDEVAQGFSKVLKSFGNPIGRKALVETVKRGAAPNASLAAIKAAEVASKNLKMIDEITGAVGFGAAEGVYSGAEAAASVENMILNMNHEKLLAESGRYRDIYDAAVDIDDEQERIQWAKETLASEAASETGIKTGLTTSLLSAPAGAFFGRLLGGRSSSLPGKVGNAVVAPAKSRAGAAGKGVLYEAIQEFGQSGAEAKFMADFKEEVLGQDVDTMVEVLNAGITGAIAAAPIGGGLGGIAYKAPGKFDNDPNAPGEFDLKRESATIFENLSEKVINNPEITDEDKFAAMDRIQEVLKSRGEGRNQVEIMAAVSAIVETGEMPQMGDFDEALNAANPDTYQAEVQRLADTITPDQLQFIRIADPIAQTGNLRALNELPPAKDYVVIKSAGAQQARESYGESAANFVIGHIGRSLSESSVDAYHAGDGNFVVPVDSKRARSRALKAAEAISDIELSTASGKDTISLGVTTGVATEATKGATFERPEQLWQGALDALQVPRETVAEPPPDATIIPAGTSPVDAAKIINQVAQQSPNSQTNQQQLTPDQLKNGNYPKPQVEIMPGLTVGIENPAGSVRRGENWERRMPNHYGEFTGTKGADGDPVDVFLGDQPTNPMRPVFVFNQANNDGDFDEHKVMMGFANAEEALAAYKRSGPSGIRNGNMVQMGINDFKNWLSQGDKGVPAEGQQVFADEPAAADDERTVVNEGPVYISTAPSGESAPLRPEAFDKHRNHYVRRNRMPDSGFDVVPQTGEPSDLAKQIIEGKTRNYRPRIDRFKFLEKLRDTETGRVQKRILAQLVDGAMAAGVPLSYIENMVTNYAVSIKTADMGTPAGIHSGVTSGVTGENYVAINGELLLEAAQNPDDAPLQMTLLQTFIHEIGHAVSFRDGGIPDKMFKAEADPEMSLGNGGLELNPAMRDLMAVYEGDIEGLSSFLSYPLASTNITSLERLRDGTETGEILIKDRLELVGIESWAQVFSLFYTAPTALRNAAPNIHAAMQEIHNGQKEFENTPGKRFSERPGPALRAAVFAAGSSERWQSIGRRGADAGGAGQGQAGAGLGSAGREDVVNYNRESLNGQAATQGLPDPERVSGGDGGLSPASQTDASTPLQGLPDTVEVPGRGKVKFGPIPAIKASSRSYMEKAGLPYNPQKRYVKVDPARAKRIADAYEAMADDLDAPGVRESYEALARETIAQYEHLLETGLQVEFMGDDNPYAATPRMAHLDVLENNHLFVYPTESGFGSEGGVAGSGDPMLQPTRFKISGRTALVNDLFRVVHDVYGHFKEGVGFRANGEENAWVSHMSMYSPLARAAATTETRGQNSWVNYGPHGDTNRTASESDTVFAEQKKGLLPDWVMTEGLVDEPAPEQSDQFKSWFGDSKTVDESGQPMVFYHGTVGDIDAFDDRRKLNDGIYFTSDPSYAGSYAEARSDLAGGGANIVPAYLKIDNPLILNGENEAQRDRYIDRRYNVNDLADQGYDGIMMRYDDGEIEAMVFDPAQIKSATGNSGAFDPADVRIDMMAESLGDRFDQDGLKEAALEGYGYTVSGAGEVTVIGDVDQFRAILSENGVQFKGRVIDGGLHFTASAQAQVESILNKSETIHSRRGAILDHVVDKDGKIVGAPKSANTKMKLPAMRKRIKALALEGANGRMWYEKSGDYFMRLFGNDAESARKFAGLTAIYSASTSVSANLTAATKAWFQHIAGVPIKAGRFGSQDRAAQDWLNGGKLKSQKITNFYNNLMRVIDQDNHGALDQGVTNDIWMMRAFGYDMDRPTPNAYRFLEVEISRIAKEFGWEPQQVQASIWVAMRARTENAEVKRKTDAQSIRAKDFKLRGLERMFKDDAARARHRERWYKNAIAADLSQDYFDSYASDYSDIWERYAGQVSWETAPGSTLSDGLDYGSLSTEQRIEYHETIVAQLKGRDGADLVAKELGLPSMGIIDGPGVWLGNVTPGSQTIVMAAPQHGVYDNPLLKNKVSEETARALNAYAAVMGRLLLQDGMGWHKPRYGLAKKRQNMVEIVVDDGRALSTDEAIALESAFAKRFEEYKGENPDISPPWGGELMATDFPLIASARGMRILNLYSENPGEERTYSIPNPDFHRLVELAARDVFGQNYDLLGMGADSNLIENNWTENPNGEAYQSAYRDAGFVDSGNRAYNLLAPKIRQARERFAQKHRLELAQVSQGPQLRESLDSQLDAALERGRGVKEKFDQLVNRYADKYGAKTKIAPLKGKSRILEKLAAEPALNVEDIGDIVRATIVVTDPDQIQSILDDLIANENIDPTKKPRNLWVSQKDVDGYKDGLIRLTIDGMKTELQINTEAMMVAKDVGHDLYKIHRSIDAKAEKTTADLKRMAELEEAMARIYALGAEASFSKDSDRTLAMLRNSSLEISRPYTFSADAENGQPRSSDLVNTTALPSGSNAAGAPSRSSNRRVPSGSSSNDISSSFMGIYPVGSRGTPIVPRGKQEMKDWAAQIPLPDELNGQLNDYFESTPGSVDIPITMLTEKPNPKQSVDNAAKYMRAAQDGVLDKRGPIRVMPVGVGYQVIDGSATTAAARRYGLTSVRAVVERPGGTSVESQQAFQSAPADQQRLSEKERSASQRLDQAIKDGDDVRASRLADDVAAYQMELLDQGWRVAVSKDAGLTVVPPSSVPGQGYGSSVQDIRGWVNGFRKLFPAIRVHHHHGDAPLSVQKKMREQFGEGAAVEAVYDTRTGEVHVFASMITDQKALNRIMLEEVFGHAGMRALFGDKLDRFLDELEIPIIKLAPIAKSYRLNLERGDHLRQAKEEYIAKMGGRDQGVLKKIIAWLRSAIRDLGIDIRMSDNDLRYLYSRAMRAIVDGHAPKLTYDGELRASVVRGNDVQEGILDRVIAKGAYEQTLGERMSSLREKIVSGFDIWSVKQGILDAGASIERLERAMNNGELFEDATQSATKSYALTKNLRNVMAAVMKFGAPVMKNGWFEIDPNGKGLVDIFRPLTENGSGNMMRLWEGYAAARRANQLINQQNMRGESREKLMSREDIHYLLELGETYPILKQVFDEYQNFNNKILDLAVDAGVLTAEAAELWQQNDYVPFYRVMSDDESFSGPGKLGDLEVRGSGIKRLHGSERKISPVLENIVLNTAALIDRVYANTAMKKIVDLGTQAGVMTKMPPAFRPVSLTNDQLASALRKAGVFVDVENMSPEERKRYQTLFEMHAPQGNDVVAMMKDGVVQYYHVSDPLLLRTIKGMGPDNFGVFVDIMRGFKGTLTNLVTADPGFMVANWLRDTLSSWVTVGNVDFTPMVDAVGSMSDIWKGGRDSVYAKVMMAGGSGGGFYDVNDGDIARSIGGGKATIVSSPRKAWEMLRRLGNVSEQSNRIAVARGVMAKGGSLAEAAYQAQDVTNFTMRGDYKAVRLLTATVPFMNARLQGLYRLYRGARDNPMQFFLRGSVVMAATLALLARNQDDERYEELPDWQKDIYWHFFIGDMHYSIPKPFEAGVIFGSMPERMVRAMTGKDDLSRDTGNYILRTISDTFAMNPIPQAFKPLIEQWANKQMFGGRAIIPFYQKHLEPEAQYKPWTSDTARLIADLMPDFMPPGMRSPDRIQHLIRGYLGTIGGYALSGTDIISNKLAGYPSRPALKFRDLRPVRRFVSNTDEVRGSKYEDLLWDGLEKANAVFSTANSYARQGRLDAARDLRREKGDWLVARGQLNSVAKIVRKINERERQVLNSRMESEAKREALMRLRKQKSELLRNTVPDIYLAL